MSQYDPYIESALTRGHVAGTCSGNKLLFMYAQDAQAGVLLGNLKKKTHEQVPRFCFVGVA